jgi:hypothetical protein
LTILTILTACNNSDSVKNEDDRIDTIKNSPTALDSTAKKDSVSIWVYDYLKEMPVKNREINADTLTPKKLIDFINSYKGGDKIHLAFVKISHDTMYVKIIESTFLTQQMGTTGADDYMSTTIFTLTELKGIKYVNFDFEEGDHAAPGTYSRQYYIDRN